MKEVSLRKLIGLKAGPIHVDFEPEQMMVRRVRVGSRELVRGIYAAIRDEAWGTYIPLLEEFEVHIDSDSFEINWLATTPVAECLGELTGKSDGTIEFVSRITAIQTYPTMRTGICVLHPAHECRGLKCSIGHPDGSVEEMAFPDHIAPHQPFFQVRSMEHQGSLGSNVKIEFEGEVFETEDQRNWTDASFKTYCRPLEWAAPYVLNTGEQVEQSIRISYRELAESGSVQEPEHLGAAMGPVTEHVVPELGLMFNQSEPLSNVECEALQSLGLSHLGFKVDIRHRDWRAKLSEVEKVGLPLEIHMLAFEDRDEDLAEAARSLKDLQVMRVLMVSENPSRVRQSHLDIVRKSLTDAVPIFATSGSNYTELNRNWPTVPGLVGVGFAANPQVHAFDNLSLMETVEMYPVLAEECKAKSNGLPVVISPITLEPRTWAKKTPDPRLHAEFGASWTVACIISLILGGVHSATFHETHGKRGVLAKPGQAPYPIETAIRKFSALQGKNVSVVLPDVPLESYVMLSGPFSAREAILVSLTDKPTVIQLPQIEVELAPYEWCTRPIGGE